MSRRFLVIALVFAVGFGVGYAATWLIVGSPDKAPAPSPATVASKAPTAPAPETTPATTAPSEPDVIVAAAPDASPAESDAAVAANDPDTAEAPDAAVLAPDVAAVETAPSAEPDASPEAPKTWWDACKGKVCLVDWGRVSGGISVREGTLEHGAEVDWAGTYAKAEKVGSLEAKRNMKVEVYAVGFAEGKPVAAWIKYKNLKGIIALSFGDKAITFKPLPD